MLRYDGRCVIVNPASETKIIKEGLKLDGKTLFRNEAAQEYFDRLRNDLDLAEYGLVKNDKNLFFFQYLNGDIKYISRKQILKASKELGEEF